MWADSEWRTAASKNNATSLTKLRQRIRRYNKDYEKEINDFKVNPGSYPEEEKIAVKESDAEEKSDEESSSEESSSEEDSDEEPKPKKKERKVKDEDDEDEDDDEDDWSLSETDESSSNDENEYGEDTWKKFLKGYLFRP